MRVRPWKYHATDRLSMVAVLGTGPFRGLVRLFSQRKLLTQITGEMHCKSRGNRDGGGGETTVTAYVRAAAENAWRLLVGRPSGAGACFAPSSRATGRRGQRASSRSVKAASRRRRQRPRQEAPLAVQGITLQSSASPSSDFLSWRSGSSYYGARQMKTLASSPCPPGRTSLGIVTQYPKWWSGIHRGPRFCTIGPARMRG